MTPRLRTRATKVAIGTTIALTAATMIASPARADVEDVVQAVGAPASGSCFDVVDVTLNWGAVPSGGWEPTWAQWLNDGRGGPACVRVLSFDDETGDWFAVGHDAADGDVLQAVGAPGSSCFDVGDASLDWAGVESGGWDPSWAQWANSSQGGPVCVRWLAYDQETQTWYVV